MERKKKLHTFLTLSKTTLHHMSSVYLLTHLADFLIMLGHVWIHITLPGVYLSLRGGTTLEEKSRCIQVYLLDTAQSLGWIVEQDQQRGCWSVHA